MISSYNSGKSSNKKKVNKIIKEYKLKMISFNPKDRSPNKFVKKLEHRMKQYYSLYKSRNEIIK